MEKFDSSAKFRTFMKGFTKGYHGTEQNPPREPQKSPTGEIAPGKADPFDVIRLFSSWNVKSMTGLEIASQLKITPEETMSLVEILEGKNVVAKKPNKEGVYLVQLTDTGEILAKK